MRELVTIRTIKDIQPIVGADMIEVAAIDGWKVVVKKDSFNIGDNCVYFEIDSWLPANHKAFEFLKKHGIGKSPDGLDRIRLKTMRMRGQLSQGLVLPLSDFSEEELKDLDKIGVVKYERPEPVSPDAAGAFPSWLQKTDEERIQNIYDQYSVEYADVEFYPTIKIDGTSSQICYLRENSERLFDESYGDDKIVRYENGGQAVICSRNLMLKTNKENFHMVAHNNGEMFDKVKLISDELGLDIAIRGEVTGVGIQGNPEKLLGFSFFAFGIYDITNGAQIPWGKAKALFEKYSVMSVPTIEKAFKVFERFKNVDEILEYADGKGYNSKWREGIVFKGEQDGHYVSFKAISNKWLLNCEG